MFAICGQSVYSPKIQGSVLHHNSDFRTLLPNRKRPYRYTGFWYRVLVIWSSDIWSFWQHFGYMVNGQSDFSTKFFRCMVISAIWSTLPRQNRGPYIQNPVYIILRVVVPKFVTYQNRTSRRNDLLMAIIHV